MASKCGANVAETNRLRIIEKLVERIGGHGAETYPQECCGALLGRDGPDEGVREVLEVLPLVNRRQDSLCNRFEITPRDVLDADTAAQQRGMEIVGWYHSHPDSPARPSEYDREHAWPWYSYVIVSVHRGVAAEMRSWRLNNDRRGHVEEPIEIIAEE
jgi:proteasome lid subunit RPN8/RPN11